MAAHRRQGQTAGPGRYLVCLTIEDGRAARSSGLPGERMARFLVPPLRLPVGGPTAWQAQGRLDCRVAHTGDMRTVRRSGEHELDVKRSRFLCALARVTTEEEARAVLRERRRQHHEARHHCFAYVLGDDGRTQKSSDDGEPAGTAGVPILEVLRRNDITNTIAVVSRYFGGILLGAGGLTRAYSGAVAEALAAVGTVERQPVRGVSTTVEHAVAGRLESDLRSMGYRIAGVHYGERVRFDLRIPPSHVAEFEARLAAMTAGAASVSLGAVGYLE